MPTWLCDMVQELPGDAPVLLLLPGLTGAHIVKMRPAVAEIDCCSRDESGLNLASLAPSGAPERQQGEVHAAAGGSHDVYVQHMVKQARQRGLRAVVFNGRGE